MRCRFFFFRGIFYFCLGQFFQYLGCRDVFCCFGVLWLDYFKVEFLFVRDLKKCFFLFLFEFENVVLKINFNCRQKGFITKLMGRKFRVFLSIQIFFKVFGGILMMWLCGQIFLLSLEQLIICVLFFKRGFIKWYKSKMCFVIFGCVFYFLYYEFFLFLEINIVFLF